MKSKVLVIILASFLVCAWGGVGVAGQITYSMRSAEKGFATKPSPEPPNSSVMAFDAIIGRPLGVATTALGAALLVVDTPFTLPTPILPLRRPGGWWVGPRGGPLFVPWGGEHPNMRKRASLDLKGC